MLGLRLLLMLGRKTPSLENTGLRCVAARLSVPDVRVRVCIARGEEGPSRSCLELERASWAAPAVEKGLSVYAGRVSVADKARCCVDLP